MAVYAPGPIPFSAIDRYARRYGYEDNQFELLLMLVSHIDRAYIAWQQERARVRAAQREAQQRARSHG